MTDIPAGSLFSGERPDVSTAKAFVPPDRIDKEEPLISTSGDLDAGEMHKGVKAGTDELPVDWFEPLEDDDEAHSWDISGHDKPKDRRDAEEDSLAGESEKSGSVASSERTFKKLIKFRRKRATAEEGWMDWPALGAGWRRREVVRRSGSSVGQMDVYYLGPRGERARSKVELCSVLDNVMDLTLFEFKTGVFRGAPTPLTKRRRKNVREHSSSESSYMEREEGAITPDVKVEIKPLDRSQEDPLPSINGRTWSPEGFLVCARCGNRFVGTAYDRQRKKPCCPRCWSTKRTVHPCIRFKKQRAVGIDQDEPEMDLTKDIFEQLSDAEDISVDIELDEEEDDMSTEDDDDWPKKRKRRACGKCLACLCRRDCGICDFCADKPKFGGSNKKRQKCRLRQCQRQAMLGQAEVDTQDGVMLFGRPRPQYTYSRKPIVKRSHLLPGSVYDEDDGGGSGMIKWSSESAGGIYRPGEISHRNLPLQVNEVAMRQRHDFPPRTRDHSNQIGSQSFNTLQMSMSTSAQELSRWGGEKEGETRIGEVEEDFPAITKIFSLAESPVRNRVDMECPLYKLMVELRSSTLPSLWYVILVDGPLLQIIQCAKLSRMADTALLIDSDFCYQITVQRQPLPATHPLYEVHPTAMRSVTEVANVLSDLERYAVCQGLPLVQPPAYNGPSILQRALTCDFLVEGDVRICGNCSALRG